MAHVLMLCVQISFHLLPTPVVDLFNFVLTSTCFLYAGEFYEQTEGMDMGSSLSPVVANFFLEMFKHTALDPRNH